MPESAARENAYRPDLICECIVKIIVVVLLLLVIVSLFSGLFFMYRDKGDSRRMVNALAVRIILSLLIFAILMASYYFEWIPRK